MLSHRTIHKGLKVIGCSLLASPSPLLYAQTADDLSWVAITIPDHVDKSFDGDLEVGYIGHSGNSSDKSLNVNTHSTWYHKHWAYTGWASADSAESNDETSAERYAIGGRARYNLSHKNYLFSNVTWDTNRFAGYRSRITAIGGYGRQILDTRRQSFSYEVGPGIRYTHEVEGNRNIRGGLYGAVNYAYNLSSTAQFTQGVSMLAASDNTMTTSSSVLNVSLDSHFSLKLAYSIEHNSSLPSDKRHKTDTTTTISIVYGL